ncbi:BON domain-containing protein [Thermogutta sp.]|uniref:BON domain-containing protein n=1 Tax=Thermogutta sp. TaxID=1962930 RepID=UPI003220724F
MNRSQLFPVAVVAFGMVFGAFAEFPSAFAQTTGSGLFGTSQTLGSSLTPGTSTRISGSTRTGTGVGMGTSSSIPITSGQFVNIQSVNLAEQLFGSSDTFVGAEASEAINPLSMQGAGTSRSGVTSGLTSRGSLSTLGRSTLGTSLLGGRSLLGSSRSTLGSRTSSRFGILGRGRTQQDIIPSALRVGFTAPQPPAQSVSQGLTALVSRVTSLRTANGAPPNVQVAVEGRTAILRGTVPSANDRLVLERLLLLEPGIDKVQNELVVAGSTGQ